MGGCLCVTQSQIIEAQQSRHVSLDETNSVEVFPDALPHHGLSYLGAAFRNIKYLWIGYGVAKCVTTHLSYCVGCDVAR